MATLTEVSSEKFDELVLRAQGPVLVDFWATWCGPCKVSLPHIQEIAADKDLAAKGLKVWAVDVNVNGESKEKAAAFVKQNNYTFAVPFDADNYSSKNYKVNAIPCTLLIGRDGTVKKVWIGSNPGTADEIKKMVTDEVNEKKMS